MNTNDFIDKICYLIASKKGYNIKILNLGGISGFAEYFIIASADSDTQVKAIADEVDDKLSQEGIKCYYKEGFASLRWVLLDYFDVIVHIFHSEARDYYNLEKLWGDAPSREYEDNLPQD